MKKKAAMLLRGGLVIGAAMLGAWLVIRMLWGTSLPPLASVGAILLTGYLGAAIYLLRHRAQIGRVTRVRLAISLLMPLALGVMVLDQPLNSEALGFLMMCGTFVALPLPWLATQDVFRGLRGLPPQSFSLADVDALRIIPCVAWGMGVSFFGLAAWADAVHLGRPSLYAAGIITLNGGAELVLLAGPIVLFVRGAFQEMGNTLTQGSVHGRDTSADDDPLLWEMTHASHRSRSSSMFEDNYSSSGGLDMWGSNDTWDHDDHSHATSFDDPISSHGSISGIHDS